MGTDGEAEPAMFAVYSTFLKVNFLGVRSVDGGGGLPPSDTKGNDVFAVPEFAMVDVVAGEVLLATSPGPI